MAAPDRHAAADVLPSEHAARPPQRGRPGHNLALRLRDRNEAVLRFVHDPSVPFTNNLAGRDLRMMKLRMKISGGFRSRQEARDFATLCSVLSTARKQGRNRIEPCCKGRPPCNSSRHPAL